jgi:hypothetical protein
VVALPPSGGGRSPFTRNEPRPTPGKRPEGSLVASFESVMPIRKREGDHRVT